MDGIIVVYKEPGFTSHDVVAKLRGILHEKRIGHTGTLDPGAAGLLPVCLGRATKVCELLADWNKEYRATLLLGRTTDTQDMTGRTLRECPVILGNGGIPEASDKPGRTVEAVDGDICESAEPMWLTEEEIRRCIAGFVGEQQQVPPMYSALKVNGKKLYELARQGIEVERKPRTICIKEIHVSGISMYKPERSDAAGPEESPEGENGLGLLPMIEVKMKVRCSKGTYIRALCHDIGEKLGCGGCMDFLLRTGVGPFTGADSWRLSEIEELRDTNRLEECVFPTDLAFTNLDAVRLTSDAERLVRNGNPLSARMMGSCRKTDDLRERFSDSRSIAYKNWLVISGRAKSAAFFGDYYGGPAHRTDQLRLYGQNWEFLAIYGYDEKRDDWRAVKMFL